jgi:hypothetical protein
LNRERRIFLTGFVISGTAAYCVALWIVGVTPDIFTRSFKDAAILLGMFILCIPIAAVGGYGAFRLAYTDNLRDFFTRQGNSRELTPDELNALDARWDESRESSEEWPEARDRRIEGTCPLCGAKVAIPHDKLQDMEATLREDWPRKGRAHRRDTVQCLQCKKVFLVTRWGTQLSIRRAMFD